MGSGGWSQGFGSGDWSQGFGVGGEVEERGGWGWSQGSWGWGVGVGWLELDWGLGGWSRGIGVGGLRSGGWGQGFFLHLLENDQCAANYNNDQFSILDTARSFFHLSLLEASYRYIKVRRPNLCKQKEIVYTPKLFK